MAQIRGIKEKQLALAEITAGLKEIEKLKEFLSADNPSGSYTLSIDKQHRISLVCKDETTIRELVTSYKNTRVSDIRKMAEEYGIDFDNEEEGILA